jgi:hypothetical protein
MSTTIETANHNSSGPTPPALVGRHTGGPMRPAEHVVRQFVQVREPDRRESTAPPARRRRRPADHPPQTTTLLADETGVGSREQRRTGSTKKVPALRAARFIVTSCCSLERNSEMYASARLKIAAFFSTPLTCAPE